MIAIPGVIGFILGWKLPRRTAFIAAVAAWAAVAGVVLAFDLAGDGSFVVPAAIALVLTVMLTAAGAAVRAGRTAKASA